MAEGYGQYIIFHRDGGVAGAHIAVHIGHGQHFGVGADFGAVESSLAEHGALDTAGVVGSGVHRSSRGAAVAGGVELDGGVLAEGYGQYVIYYRYGCRTVIAKCSVTYRQGDRCGAQSIGAGRAGRKHQGILVGVAGTIIEIGGGCRSLTIRIGKDGKVPAVGYRRLVTGNES